MSANSIDARAYAPASAQAPAVNTAARSAAAALAALPPPGLSGPTSFCFSPPCLALDGPSYVPFDPESKDDSLGGRYLSFLSASGGGAKSIANQPRNVDPPLKSAMTSGSKSQQQQQATAATERRLCVIDLEPFTRQLRREEEEYYESVFGYELEERRDAKTLTDRNTCRRCDSSAFFLS